MFFCNAQVHSLADELHDFIHHAIHGIHDSGTRLKVFLKAVQVDHFIIHADTFDGFSQ